MSANEIHVADTGTIIEVTIKDGTSVVDISTATTKQILLRKEDGTVLTKTATFKTDGTDGILRYTTLVTDLTPAGHWQLQAYVVLSSGAWKTDWTSFDVWPNLA